MILKEQEATEFENGPKSTEGYLVNTQTPQFRSPNKNWPSISQSRASALHPEP